MNKDPYSLDDTSYSRELERYIQTIRAYEGGNAMNISEPQHPLALQNPVIQDLVHYWEEKIERLRSLRTPLDPSADPYFDPDEIPRPAILAALALEFLHSQEKKVPRNKPR